MENLIFSLNATLPIFFTMILGGFFKKIHLFDDAFVKRMNTFVFKVALPVQLFLDLGTADFVSVWDTKYVLFCFFATLTSILIVFGISFLWRDRSIQGEFIQASYRSSAAILGIAFIQNIYGTSGMAPLMIIGTVPLYNIIAVTVLSVMKPEREAITPALVKKTLKEILTNPILIGIAAGFLWSILSLPMPLILNKTLKNISVLATPLGLMSMGAAFQISRAREQMKPAITASLCKLLGLAALFLPVAIALGFRDEKLIAVLIMLASPTTVTSYIMAKNMGHDGSMTSATVMLTTLCSAFTLTMWLFILKSLGYV